MGGWWTNNAKTGTVSGANVPVAAGGVPPLFGLPRWGSRQSLGSKHVKVPLAAGELVVGAKLIIGALLTFKGKVTRLAEPKTLSSA